MVKMTFLYELKMKKKKNSKRLIMMKICQKKNIIKTPPATSSKQSKEYKEARKKAEGKDGSGFKGCYRISIDILPLNKTLKQPILKKFFFQIILRVNL